MKIGQFENKPPVPVGISERKGPNPARAGGAPTAEVGATVALSAAAALLTAPGKDGDFDTAKVARISQAIRDGKFEVNAGAIADKLIANAQELLSRTSQR